jgi:hypothetical protein
MYCAVGIPLQWTAGNFPIHLDGTEALQTKINTRQTSKTNNYYYFLVSASRP